MPSTVYLANGAKGHLVKKLQLGMNALGLQCSTDGDFGPGTEVAVKGVQPKLGLPATGVVDLYTWKGVVKEDVPTLYERCLMLTMGFEGHGFNLSAGNWDGAGITWGIIGFTLSSGSLYDVMLRIPFSDVASCFGTDNALVLMEAIKTRNKAWADSISAAPKKFKLNEPWQSAFWKLGDTPSAQAAQKSIANEKYWVPSQDRLTTNLPQLVSERAASMSFDCHVNQGGIYKTSIQYAKDVLAKGGTEQAALEAIAQGQRDGLSAAAKASFGQDVYTRRLAIAQGVGKVHGRIYELSDYGINLVPR